MKAKAKATLTQVKNVRDVIVNSKKRGTFARFVDEPWFYFPDKISDMTGDEFIAIGELLNEMNEGEK